MRDWFWLVLPTLFFSLSALTIRQIPLTGGLCGSVFLDLAFQKYIETIIGEMEFKSIKESNRKKMMREFEYGIKRCFSEQNDQTYSVDLKGVKDDPKNGIVDDTITVKMYRRSQVDNVCTNADEAKGSATGSL